MSSQWNDLSVLRNSVNPSTSQSFRSLLKLKFQPWLLQTSLMLTLCCWFKMKTYGYKSLKELSPIQLSSQKDVSSRLPIFSAYLAAENLPEISDSLLDTDPVHNVDWFCLLWSSSPYLITFFYKDWSLLEYLHNLFMSRL